MSDYIIPTQGVSIVIELPELAFDRTPAQAADGAWFTVGASTWHEDRKDPYWLDDHTVMTDNYQVALLWAWARLSRSNDGDNVAPVARIMEHAERPLDIDWESDADAGNETNVAAYVTSDGEIERDHEAFAAIAETTFEWSEIAKCPDGDDG
jgi:hypothetical protein